MSDLSPLKTSDFPADNTVEAFHQSRRWAREAILRYRLSDIEMSPIDGGVFASMFRSYDAKMQRDAAKSWIAIARQHLKGTYVRYTDGA